MCTECYMLQWYWVYDNEPLGSIQDGEIFYQLSVCCFLKKDYSARNQSVKWVSMG
jgi:hypothetical protein